MFKVKCNNKNMNNLVATINNLAKIVCLMVEKEINK